MIRNRFLPIIFSCIFLIAPALLFAQELESDQTWERIILQEAGCELNAPGPMTEKVDTVETAIGTIVYHTFFYKATGNGPENYLYMFSYCDYPVGAIHSDSTDLLDEFFETTMEAAASTVYGEVIYNKEIDIKNYPGRFWRINYLDDQAIIRTKAYVVENRYYAIQTIMHRERSLNPASDRFLDSFKLF